MAPPNAATLAFCAILGGAIAVVVCCGTPKIREKAPTTRYEEGERTGQRGNKERARVREKGKK